MGTVFLSHSTQDVETARQIAAAIRAAGGDVWIAPDSILPGESYNEAIVAGVRGCDILAILVSPASNASRHVAREVALADDNGKRIVPIRIDAVEPSDGLKYYLGLAQWVEWHTHGPAALSAFLGLLGSGGGARPSPADDQSQWRDTGRDVQPPFTPPSPQPSASVELEIRRKSGFSASLRSVAILDGEVKLGEVGNGGVFSQTLSAGRHEIRARMDGVKSEPLIVDSSNGGRQVYELQLGGDLKSHLVGMLGNKDYFKWSRIG